MRQTETTMYVVIPFTWHRKRIIPAQPRTARDELHAKALALRLSETHPGVIAFSRAGDPDTGDYDDAVILARYGDVPDEAAEAIAA